MDVRKVIKARMRKLGWTNYRLAVMVRDFLSPSSVYEFLSGKSQIGSQGLGEMLTVLGLEIVAAPDSVSDSKPARRAGRKRKQA